MKIEECIKPQGEVECIIEYNDGRPTETISFKNTILQGGRSALAKSLANDIGDQFEFYVNRMTWGSQGTTNGVKKFVNSSRVALFGTTVLSKPVVSSVVESQVIFTSLIAFNDIPGTVINEMALQMANGDLYSMVTFEDLTKSSSMQLTWNWRLTFV
jgi:hypothetical protein